MTRNLLPKLAVTAMLLFPAGAALAQANASLTGVVTDASGAVVPDTVVTLTNPHTGVKFTAKTDSAGSYRFPNVPPDPGYAVSFEHSGFSTSTVNNIALNVGVTQTRNAQLAAGGASEQVEVTANNAAETINTTDATIGNNIDIKMVDDLPVQNRLSPTALFTLQPGVNASSYGSSGNPTSVSVTGARTDQNSMTLDGMDVNDIAAGGSTDIVGNAPVDSVQEFRGTVAGLVSSQGTGSGGQFQLVTRNGTNSFHGNLNEYHRDPATVANTWFNNLNHLPKTHLVQNQFGGALGGPILKDKLFFFFDFNNNRVAKTVPTTRTVPTASFLAGNVNYINNGTGCNSSSRLNTQPQCITTLTPSQVQSLDPQSVGESQAILTFLNARYGHLTGGVYDPTTGDGVNTIGYRYNAQSPDINYAYVGRVDYNLTPHQRVFARLNIAHEDRVYNVNEFPTDPTTSTFQDRSYGYVVSHIWEIGNNKVNQFYYGDTVSEYNFPNNWNPAGTNEYTFTKSIANVLSGPYLSGASQRRRVPIPEVRDDFNWMVGHHNLTMGGTFKFIKTNSRLVNDFNFVNIGYQNSVSPLEAAPSNLFLGNGAIYDWAGSFDTILGSIAEVDSNYNFDRSANALQQGNGATRRYRYFQTELYAGDVWKVTPKLTLDYGLRWQIYSVPYEANGFESIQNLSFQQYVQARVAQSTAGTSGDNVLPFNVYSLGGKANNAPAMYNQSWKDIAPRFAFAYSFTPKTVLNGSAGIVYDRTVINAVNFIQDQSSQLFQATLSNPQTNGLAGNPRVTGTTSSNYAGSTVINLAYPALNSPAGLVGKAPFTPYVSGGTPFGLGANAFNNIVDPNLKTPYNINFNLGLQQELPGNMILRLNYVSRLGRRLLAQADASQLIDFTDKASGQTMGAAFANLETQARAGKTYKTVTPIPWFENEVAPGFGARFGTHTNTGFVLYELGTLLQRGDFADTLQALASFGLLPSNVGMASQWAGNTYLTNMGFSSYNGLLLTLSKNLSHGLQFDFNYTFQHSMDNTSSPANFIASSAGTGFICDVLRPRECRANSDFDVTNAVKANFVYDLPFGRKQLVAGNAPLWLDEIIGGWQLSGIPQWQSGYALNTSTNAFVAGYANNAPAIFNGMRGDVAIKPHKVGSTVLGFANCATATSCTAQADFSYPTGFTIGQRNALRGPSQFFFDAGIAKHFAILPNDRANLAFRADFFNVLNHPVFSSPSTDISQSNGLAFGQITSVVNGTSGTGARVGQFSLKLAF